MATPAFPAASRCCAEARRDGGRRRAPTAIRGRVGETAFDAASSGALSPTVPRRCFWAVSDELLAAYHDAEWGVPIHDDRRWYEKLLLDGAQAGLSWLTILKKREGYREAFAGFDPSRVACFTDADVERLMNDARIVRNRLKIRSAITNARAFLALQQAEGSFDAWIWKLVGGKPIRGRVKGPGDMPARTPLSDALSKELRARGFNFVGSTIVYAFMQAGGLVNDHTAGCFRGRQVEALAGDVAGRPPARGQRAARSRA
jgi:DNA-3-methyladenine glycosylase I